MTQINLKDMGEQVYLHHCAKMRCISLTSLTRRLLRIIVRDRMVDAILDDNGKAGRLRGEHRYHERQSELEQ